MADVKAASATTTTHYNEATEVAAEQDAHSMPVASIALCEEGEEKESELSLGVEDEETCHDEPTSCRTDRGASSESTSSAPSLILPLPVDDNVSISSPDSGHGTSHSEHEAILLSNQHHQAQTNLTVHAIGEGEEGAVSDDVDMAAGGLITAVLPEPSVLAAPGHIHAHPYSWMNGQHQSHRVMEPVAINPETGFTTVLVDAAAMAGYPHHAAPAHHHHHPPHYHYPHHQHQFHQSSSGHHHFPPHPPPHFLHPNPYHHEAMAAEYGGGVTGPGYLGTGGGYDPALLNAPGYDPTAGMFHDVSSLHLSGGYGGPNSKGGSNSGRNHRAGRGSSVSPKRPTNRSTSQHSSSNGGSSGGICQQQIPQHQRRPGQPPPPTSSSSSSSTGGGRYTPSPSSGRSRGSSPAHSQPPLISASSSCTNNSSNPMMVNHNAVPAGPLPSNAPGQHVVHLHVNPGETVSLQMGGQVQVIQGPATVRMVSTGSPPVPLPVQVPPGHVLQQIVDERGTLRHVILSPAPATNVGPAQPPPPLNGVATASSSGQAGVLPLATPTHPPPLPTHAYGSSHNMGQPPPSTTPAITTTATGSPPGTTTPPMYYGTNSQGGGGGGYPAHHHHHHHHQQPYGTHGPLLGQPRSHTGFSMPPRVPSPPSGPPIIYHSERAQRLHMKLRKKSEQNRLNKIITQPAAELTTATSYAAGSYSAAESNETPPSSPKKDNNNVRKLKDRNQNGTASTVYVGADDSNAKEEKMALRERISELKAPTICDVVARGATVTWEPVETVIVETNESPKELDISYEVVIGQKGKAIDNFSYKRKKDCNLRLADLQPGTNYWIRLSALVNDIQAREAAVVEFRTDSCAPDTPEVKMQNRTRSSLNVRWSQPIDNGSPISQYVLECDDGSGSLADCSFTEVYRGRSKQFTIGKLQPSTCYAIRLAACNEIGTSDWSDILRTTTMGAPPPPPAPPVLVNCSAKHITLCWDGSSTDFVYTLQMADPTTGHGFLNVYHGPDSEYTCGSLWRSTTYRFRLQTQNDDGLSRWSDEISYCTLADRPVAPARPGVKGRISAHSFKVRWESPSDSGGSTITQYSLELDSGDGFVLLWSGSETELVLDKLTPGTTYRVRVFCFNGQEQSDYSEPLIVTTEPVCPGAPAPPSLAGKARATNLQLKWERPDYDGGSMLTQYEVNLINPDNSSRIVFSGYETECLVASLLPGRSYSFQVRASNRIGFGPWSELIEIKSGPGAPEAPAQPTSTHRTSHSVALTWNEPASNGAPISEFRLEMASNRRVAKSPSNSSLNSDAAESISEELDVDNLTFNVCHSLSGKQYEVKGLQPASVYYFRLQAINVVGPSAYSPMVSFTTLASSPATVSGLRCTAADTTSFTLTWNNPQSNGSAITFYNIELSDKGIYCTNEPVTSFAIEDLSPDTQYRVRIQAANGIGVGPFSTAAKFNTRPLPPPAPRLECAQIGHNSLKLRWGDGKNLNFLNYSVEMQEEGNERFYVIYEGPGQSYKVSKLKETTAYAFRICARNEVGEGPYSDPSVFNTTRAPPPTLKRPDVFDITDKSCRITWSAQRLLLPSDCVVYQIELTRSKEQDLVMMKRCSENELVADDLDPHTEYSVKVCPIRLCQDGEIPGTCSPSKTFNTHSIESLTSNDSLFASSSQTTSKIPKPLTDQQWGLIIISAFIAFSILIAVVMNQLVDT